MIPEWFLNTIVESSRNNPRCIELWELALSDKAFALYQKKKVLPVGKVDLRERWNEELRRAFHEWLLGAACSLRALTLPIKFRGTEYMLQKDLCALDPEDGRLLDIDVSWDWLGSKLTEEQIDMMNNIRVLLQEVLHREVRSMAILRVFRNWSRRSAVELPVAFIEIPLRMAITPDSLRAQLMHKLAIMDAPPPCPDEYRLDWGYNDKAQAKRCLYCPGQTLCDQFIPSLSSPCSS